MKIYDVRGIGASLTGSFSGSFKGLFTGPLDGVAATSSYVEYSNVANKPALVSGSSQVSFTGITNKPTLVSGSSQVTYSGLSGIPNGIVSGSSQVLGFNVFATTGSNQFNGNQSITGSLTVSGQVIAQTLNVQQVTSSIVFSSGSNRFGNNSGNTHSFTGSVNITGSLSATSVRIAAAGTANPTIFRNTSGTTSSTSNSNVIGFNSVNNIFVSTQNSGGFILGFNNSVQNREYTLPDASGTVALTTNLSSYLPLSGGTLTGALNGTIASFTKSSNSGSGADFPRLSVKNTLATQGDGTSTFNFADIMISAGNEAVNMFLATTYAAGTWAPAGIINVSTNHDLQFKTNNTTRLTLANSGAATFSNSVGVGGASTNRLTVFASQTGTQINTTPVVKFINTGNEFSKVIIGSDNTNYDGVISMDNNATLANTKLRFYIGNGSASTAGHSNDQIVLQGNGNVGINTSSPNTRLTIAANTSGATGFTDYFKIGSDLNNFLGDGGYPSLLIGTLGVYDASIATIGSDLRIYSGRANPAENHNIRFYTGFNGDGGAAENNERMRIEYDGRVGIGNTSPVTRLTLGSYSGARLPYINGTAATFDAAGITVTSANSGNAAIGGGLDLTNNTYSVSAYSPIISFSSRSFSGAYNNSYAGIWGQLGGTGGDNNWVAGALVFGTAGSYGINERMRITSTGYVYLGNGFSATNHRINLGVNQGGNILVVSAYESSPPGSANDTAIFYGASGASPNAAATALGVMTNSSTGRSINAGGTINASGADYAEYMTKAVEDNIAKGDIVGIDSNAKVTNIFANAISFAVKSTDPSYVGGDVWGNSVGKRPERTTDQTEEEFAPILAEFEAELEIARAKVDRISFSGQVPCNIIGASVGDYIIPVETENGKIGGQAIPNPTFEQYQMAVGKVWKIMEDGRTWIAVKIG